MTNDINKVKAYAAELERLLDVADINPTQRPIINSMIGSAKEKFNMYNN